MANLLPPRSCKWDPVELRSDFLILLLSIKSRFCCVGFPDVFFLLSPFIDIVQVFSANQWGKKKFGVLTCLPDFLYDYFKNYSRFLARLRFDLVLRLFQFSWYYRNCQIYLGIISILKINGFYNSLVDIIYICAFLFLQNSNYILTKRNYFKLRKCFAVVLIKKLLTGNSDWHHNFIYVTICKVIFYTSVFMIHAYILNASSNQ